VNGRLDEGESLICAEPGMRRNRDEDPGNKPATPSDWIGAQLVVV